MRRIITTVLGGSLLVGLAAVSAQAQWPNRSSVQQGPVKSNDLYYRLGNGTGPHVRFITSRVELKPWTKAACESAAQYAAKYQQDHMRKSHIASTDTTGGRLLLCYWTLPSAPNDGLLLVWHNVDNSQMGWVSLRNTGEAWQVMNKDPTRPDAQEGTVRYNSGRVMDFKSQTNGFSVTIRVEIPPPGYGFTVNDLLYAFAPW